MPLVVPAGYGRVVHSISLVGDNEPMACTYGIEAGDTAVALETVVAELHDAFCDAFLQRMSTSYTITQTELYYQGDEPPAPQAVYVKADPRSGIVGTSCLPNNSANLVHKRTARAGRRGRGRMYVPCVQEDQVDETGKLATAYLTAYQTLLTTWLARFNVGNLANVSMVLLHNQAAVEQTPAPPLTYSPDAVTSLTIDNKIATQRRRMRR